MFVIGAIPGAILVPLMLKYLPESDHFLRVRAGLETRAAATKPSRNPVSTLFHHGMGRSTIAFWITTIMGLLLVYGLNTWLPQIMRSAGYQLGAALALLLPRYRPALLPAAATIALLLAGAALDGPVERYRYPLDPLIMILAAGGYLSALPTLARAVRARRR
jgi:hypothetical protein